MMRDLILLQRPDPIDFFMLLRDLDYAGHSVRAIARALGRGESTVRAWKTHEPLFEDGRAVIQLYEQVLRRTPPTKSGAEQAHIVRSGSQTFAPPGP